MKYLIIIFGFILIATIGVFIFRSSGNPDLLTNYPSPNPDIIAYGDSLVEGVGSTDDNDFVSLLSAKIGQHIVNLGHSGDTTADGIARIGELDAYNPKVVLLLLGGNDHLKQIPITETHNNLAILIQNIQARGAVVLLLGVRGGLFNDRFGPEFQILSKTYHTALVPDVLSGLFGDTNYMSDTVHPNNAGYQIIANRIYPVLASLLK